jgi:hypothetical protein
MVLEEVGLEGEWSGLIWLNQSVACLHTHSTLCYVTQIITCVIVMTITYLLTYLLTPWNSVLLEKLTGLQLVKKFPAFYRTESSVPQSQVPATCPCPDHLDPVQTPISHFLVIQLNIILPYVMKITIPEVTTYGR